jgi:adenylate kinase family enzyme
MKTSLLQFLSRVVYPRGTREMKRVAIIGSGGSGKSTLARDMGRRLELPVYHLDKLFWSPNWVERPKQEWQELQESLCAKPTWVMDGNYGGTMDIRLTACDTVIFLDMPRMLCFWRIVKRFVKYRGNARPDMTQGCEERLTREFLLWVWNYPRDRRPGILAKLETLEATKNVIVLNSPRAAQNFLSGLTQSS